MTRPSEWVLPSPGAGGGVARVGDTVRRLPAKTPEAMRVVLAHLEAVGFPGAPRLLGTDEHGRYVLSYVNGDVAHRPYAPWAASDRLLASVARLLHQYHVAMSSLRPPPGLAWPTSPPVPFAGQTVGHLDVSLANVVCWNGQAIGLIDFEEVGLVDAVWDVARTVRHWIPLIDPTDLEDSFWAVNGRQAERLRLFADEYGLSDGQRARLVEAVLANANATYERMRKGAEDGNPGYLREWHGGWAERNRRGWEWAGRHRDQFTDALLSGRR